MSARRHHVALLGVVLASTVCAAPAVERIDGPREAVSDDLAVSAWRVFDARDGLPQSTAYALAQDADGGVYVGTEAGVARFDGVRWESLAMPASVAPSAVSDLLVDADNVLWAADDVFGLLRRAPSGAMEAVPFDTPGSVHAEELAPAPGGVWLSSPQGLFRCDATRCRSVAALAGRPVAALAVDDDTTALWLGIEGEGLFRLDAPDSDAPRLVGPVLTREDGLPNESLRALAFWHGDLWIGTGRGLARWNGHRLVVYDAATGFGDGIVRSLRAGYDSEGQPRLLATQSPGGVAMLRPDGSWRRIGTRNGLPEDSAASLLDVHAAPGRPGALWIGTLYSGVVREEPGNWQGMDERAGLPHRAVIGMGRVVLPDGRPRQWLGTVRGSVAWVDGRWRPWLPQALRDDPVYAVETLGDTVWIATGAGLVRWRGDDLVTYTARNSALPGSVVLGLVPQPRPGGGTRLWYTTRHGMGYVDDDELFADPVPERLLGGAWFRSLALSGAGSAAPVLWAGGEAGIAFDRGAGWEALPRTCLPHPDVMDLRLHADADGREQLWVGTRGGIVRIDPRNGACTPIDAPALARSMVYQLQFDRRGRLYAFGFDGVRRLRLDLPHATPGAVPVEHIGMADGLPSLEFNRASLVDVDGRLWAGSTGGLAIYDPAGEVRATVAAPLHLIRAAAGDSAIASGQRLDADSNGLRFDYRLVTARREHRNRYRTQLDGLDAVPGPWSSVPSTSYSRVPPGDYTFRVWSEDEHGMQAGPEELRFSIAYPLWRQPAAWVGYALLLVGLGMGMGRWRARAESRRADALAREVSLRTAELARANAQLERASRTDPLTGLWNRRHFYETVPTLLARTPRLALLLIDIDHFKAINDGHGHHVGDLVLKEFAARLAAHAGEGEVALRWGGEEFLLALPEHGVADTRARAAAVMETIRSQPIVCESSSLAVTCSIGWLCLPWHDAGLPGISIDQALALADSGLYRAKAQGRARAVGVLPGRADDPRPLPHLPPVRYSDDDTASAATLLPFRR